MDDSTTFMNHSFTIIRINVGKVRFSKTTHRYKLYVSCGLIFNSGPNTVIMVWLGYGGKTLGKHNVFA